MISSMKARLDAIRSLLYETTRFVDIYKAYGFIAHENPLTKPEQEEMKKYQKQADIFTPLVKGISSEICNSMAYDSLQIHGGSGFMKEYPIERIYRDARITTIYEGTTQLQMVAAIRGITTGGYLAAIRDYEAVEIKPELQTYRRTLINLTEEFEDTVKMVTSVGDNEYIDFHARRMVEMAGNIIMGYLLMHDTNRNHDYWKSLEIFLRIARSENKERAERIRISNINDLGRFKQE
jgi:hypothetical protein